MQRLSVGVLFLAVACGSSSSEPIDPLATEYCAACSELSSCERVTNETLKAACPDETHAYYRCLTDNSCDDATCEAEWNSREICMGNAPVDQVRERIASLAPAANLGHRGTGPTRKDHPLPENSISSLVAAMLEGADGVEVDVEITMDGALIVMHDDTLDRTTDCSGCVSAMTFDQVRACRLLDGDGNPTEERPPSLVEVYNAVDGNALINVELKVFEAPCLTETTGPEALVSRALEEVARIGGEDRTLFSSFDETAAGLVKTQQPGYYSAFISLSAMPEDVQTAVDLGQDAIHPSLIISAETVTAALDAGLQVNVWVPNTSESMQTQIDKGATGIITNEPAILADLLASAP